MKINSEGLELIKSFEGCRLKAYEDQGGKLTVGWGHTGPEVVKGLTIDSEKALQLLLQDVSKFEGYVTNYVKAIINDNQFAALVSFCYNVGPSNLSTSTLLKYVNAYKFKEASDQFLEWVNIAGKPDRGLKRRREAERELFLK